MIRYVEKSVKLCAFCSGAAGFTGAVQQAVSACHAAGDADGGCGTGASHMV